MAQPCRNRARPDALPRAGVGASHRSRAPLLPPRNIQLGAVSLLLCGDRPRPPELDEAAAKIGSVVTVGEFPSRGTARDWLALKLLPGNQVVQSYAGPQAAGPHRSITVKTNLVARRTLQAGKANLHSLTGECESV